MNRNPAYLFARDIRNRLKGFEPYLQVLGNGASTIRQKINYAGFYLTWLESERLPQEQAGYNDMLSFIDHCRLEGRSKRQINTMLRSIRNYYDYLKESNPETTNPALSLHVRGERQKLPSGIVPWPELEKTYEGYPATTVREKRNKVILGLLICQGVTTGELQRMEPAHLRLKEGKISIPGTRRSNSRVLALKPFQVMALYRYLTGTRPEILQGITGTGPGRKPDRIDKTELKERLFISINGSENIKNSLLHMFRDIRRINPDIRSPKQIRASVITWWLKSHNLRQVQYMAGHKHVSSTERYQLNNLDNLQRKLEQFHPLG